MLVPRSAPCMDNTKTPLRIDTLCRVCHKTDRPLHGKTLIKIDDSKDFLEPFHIWWLCRIDPQGVTPCMINVKTPYRVDIFHEFFIKRFVCCMEKF